MWHDKSAGLGHAGEGKMVCGMTGWGEAPRKRENSSSSEVSCGRRGKESTPEEGKSKSSGTLELLTGVNKVPSSKIVNLP